MGAGVRAAPPLAQLPASTAVEPALCSGGAALALLGLLSTLHLLLYHLRGSSAAAAPPALHAVRPGAPPADAAAAYPRRSDCVVEAQWEAALQPGGRLPWSNAGTYDALLLRELAEAGVAPTHGYYVESGAWKGEKLSHSWLYESHLCWTGLLVEPSGALFECARNRPASAVAHAALVDSAHNGSMLAAGIDSEPTNSAPVDDSLVRAVKPDADTVPAYSLEALLAGQGVGPRGVAWWTLDVEGLEMQVLRGLGAFRPKIVVIEVWDVDTEGAPGNKAAVLEFMRSAGYAEGRAIGPRAQVPPIQDFLFLYEGE